MPDCAVVDELDEGHDDADEIQQRHQGGYGLVPAQAEKGRLQRGQQHKEGGADEKVIADQGHIPALLISPGVEQREGSAPEEPCQKIRQGGFGKQGDAAAVLHEYQGGDDRHQDGHEILCPHILPYVDVEGDETDEIGSCGQEPADEIVLAGSGDLHGLSSFLC